MKRSDLFQIALALAVLAFCAAGFFACFERREVEIATGASRAARSNNYLALGRLLERMGHELVVDDDPARIDRLPEPQATLIFPTNRASISAQRSQALLDWTARGGHLVLVTYSLWSEEDEEQADDDDARPLELHQDRPDPILDRFGLRQRLGEPASDEGDEESGAPPAPPPPAPELDDLLAGRLFKTPVEVSWAYFDELDLPLEVGFSAGFRWDDPNEVAAWWVEGPAGVHLLEVPHGRGKISALTSDEPLTNGAISDLDNAEFILRWLRRDGYGDDPIWILYSEAWPSFFSLLRRHALPALLGCAALVLLWIWRSIPRFGPLLPAPSIARRSWLEHLEAAGRFHWRQDHGRALLAGMRAELAHELARRHPGWLRLPERERFERIAQASGASLGEVEHAFHGTLGGARAFVAATSALERIRAAL